MKKNTCVEFFENFMFRKVRIQARYVADVSDAVPKATDLKISLGEGLDVLDLLSPIWWKNKFNVSAHMCV